MANAYSPTAAIGEANSAASNATLSGFLLLSRLLLSPVFILAGFHKLTHVSGTLQTMHQHGVPGWLIWPVIALELAGGIALLFGFLTRFLAICFAIFCILTAIIFHLETATTAPAIVGGLKDIALAGGFLALAMIGAGTYAIDSWLRDRIAEG